MMNYETTPKIKYGFETIKYSSYFWSKIECSMVADFDLSYPNPNQYTTIDVFLD